MGDQIYLASGLTSKLTDSGVPWGPKTDGGGIFVKVYLVRSNISNFVPSKDKTKDDIQRQFVSLTHAKNWNLPPHHTLIIRVRS